MLSATPPALEPRLTLEQAAGEIDPSEVQDALLRKALVLWQELRGDRLYPSRQQLTPRVLGPLLRHAILIKVLDDGREFQIRIIGDAIAAVQNIPMQGLTTAEIDRLLPGYGTMVRQSYMRACAEKLPQAYNGRILREADQRTFNRELLLLPLGDTDEAVDHLITFVVYMAPPA